MTRLVDKAKADYDEQNWQDTGCVLEDSCLNCCRTIDQCPAVNGHVFQRDRKLCQDEKIMTRINHGWTNEQIRADLGISESTIARAKARNRKTDNEYANWKDTGCEYEPSCLECSRPLEMCPDMVRGLKTKIRISREKEAVWKCRADGLTIKQIAKALHLHPRTVNRRLKGD